MKFSATIDAGNVNVKAGNVIKGAKAIQTFSKLAKRKSIMTMAEPGMYQYPLLTSNGIDMDIIAAFTKAYQLTYASSVVTAYSLNPIMYLKDTPELTDFVRKFHTNSIDFSNVNLDGAANALGIESLSKLEDADMCDVAVEASMDNSYTTDELHAMSIGAWDDVTNSVTMESLNDMYRPYKRTERILQEKIDIMKSAKEGFVDDIDDIAGRINSGSNYSTSHPLNGGGSSTVDKTVTTKYDKHGNIIGKTENDVEKTITKPPVVRNFTNAIVRNNQLDALEPTMVNVQVLCHGKPSGGGQSDSVQYTQNITLGIKVMPRVINSDLMIASMIEACKSNHAIFKFINWTKNEVKTLDFILGISASKKKALEKNAKQELKLINLAKKRRKVNGVGKFVKNEVLPTLSIVITSYEASKIKEACGVDLNDLKEAVKMMNKYYLLSFGIYDTEQNTLKVLFDCDSDWAYTSIINLRNGVTKTNDVLNQNAIYQLFGRR